jgi:hypothetical protein
VSKGPQDANCDSHRAEVEPTQSEIDSTERFFAKKRRDEPDSQLVELRNELKALESQLRAPRLSDDKCGFLEEKRRWLEHKIADEKPRSDFLIKDIEDRPSSELKEIQKKLAKTDLPKQEREALEQAKQQCELQVRHPYRFFAAWTLSHWKLQKHIYEHYGRGRLIWQQTGLEAIDAERRLVESEEQKGTFKITDPKLRESFYHYWKRWYYTVVGNEDRIRVEFLEPEWAPRRAVRAPRP